MQAPLKPANEDARLKRLESYGLLDTAAEADFDDITKLAAFICGTPTALLSLMDSDRQWFKSRVGFPEAETTREVSFCGHMVFDGRSLTVPDTHLDERFADNPLVTGDFGVRFYAGHPLVDEAGETLGSLCVLDSKPRELTPAQNEALAALSRQAVAQMRLRRDAIVARELTDALQESQRLLKQYFSRDDVFMGIVEFTGDEIHQLYNNPVVEAWFDSIGIASDVFTRETPLPGLDEWFKLYEACARTHQTQHHVSQQPFTGAHQRSTVHYVGESNEGVPRMAFTVEDITQQREAERLVEAQRQMVAQSAKLSSLGEMAAGMAHEINNPLAIIGGRAQELRMLIDRGDADPRALANAIGSIEKTVQRISKIIRGLRSFARESSRDPLETVVLSEILQDTLAFCTARFNAHGIQLEVRTVGESATVRARPSEISQVLLNLLNNAFDAVREEKVPRRVQVDIYSTDDGFEIAIVDSGPGVPVAVRDKIMQPFFTTKPINQGTGLGLSISRGIVEAHGGRLFLDEAAAETRFVVWFPRP